LRHAASRRRAGKLRPAPALAADAALFLDVDGTLLDIAPRPDAVTVPKYLVATLNRLARALGGAVALISGRKHAELRALFHGARVMLIGEHGAAAAPRLPALAAAGGKPPAALVEALRRFAHTHPGALLEIKRHGVALHVRGLPGAARPARRLAAALARSHRDPVRLIRGKAVYEFVARGISKGRAVTALMQTRRFRGRIPVFVGDDVTDEDGFIAVNRLGGVSIKVCSGRLVSSSTGARFAITGPAQMRQWLQDAASALDT
jgi:trehalose 6-phosphate phosphatase